MTEQQLAEAVLLWKSGMKAADIVAAVGTTIGSFNHNRNRQRHLFPERKSAGSRGMVKTSVQIDRGNTMEWVTESGARVTLPKISFLAR